MKKENRKAGNNPAKGNTEMRNRRTLHAWMLVMLSAVLLITGCKQQKTDAAPEVTPAAEETAEAQQNGDIYVLFTSDIHCGVQSGIGVIGLAQIRDQMRNSGKAVLLVDDGDAIQGEPLGTLTKGEAIIDLMNALEYDVAIPGNHDFDYGVDNFLKLTERAEFPYLSCNFNKEGELLLQPYLIREAAGKKIGFVGVTTPQTLTACNPKNFMDEDGKYIYGFLQDDTGDLLINAIQENVDKVREEGADYVILMGHIGNREEDAPYNFQTIIERTSGIDAFVDGHSHDTDQVTMNNKDGKPVVRSACGTKMEGVGYIHIQPEEKSINGGLMLWLNTETVPDMLGLHNELNEPVQKVYDALDQTLKVKIGETPFDLVINDPVLKKENGEPVRIVRTRETNLADFVADSILNGTDAELAIVNSGSVRDTISAGDITYGDIMRVTPFTSQICVSEVTGQQLLDALEWGARNYPGECPCLMQVSGMSYQIDSRIKSSISVDVDGQFVSVDGPYRVTNVMVGEKPLDLKQKYRIAGVEFFLKNKGDGCTMFSEDDIVLDQIEVDNHAVINYLKDKLNGTVPEEYADPYGQGRITIIGDDTGTGS